PQNETVITIASKKDSKTVKQNLTCQAKYNQGFGYAKKAVELALETGYKNELNKLLQNWIKETERKIHYNLNKPNKENLPNISNPYLTHTKEANQQNDHEKKSSKYVCSYCKGVGHNFRTCEHKKL
ncbi:9498_t:CDS:2, partial [Racocetra fulgida]